MGEISMLRKSLVLVLAAASLCAANVSFAGLNYDDNVPADLQKQMDADITMAVSLKGDSASGNYKAIFGGTALDGDKILGFFNQRVKSVGMDDCGGGPSVAACVQPFFDSTKMWITPNYIRFKAPQLYRLSVVLHESRHTEDAHGNWPHAVCPTPYRDEQGNDIKGILSGTLMAGHPACDTTILGAYGLQATLLKNVELYCKTCNEKVKQDAQIFGDDTILRISNLAQRQKLRKDLSRKSL
jgi:hypothetical protein